MSIKRIQTERVLNEVSRTMHASGVRPLLNDILSRVSKHFGRYPAGLPLPIPPTVASSEQPSDVKAFNQALAHVAENLDVLYEVALEHIDDIMVLTNTLQTNLQRLKSRQRRVETKIDDYLLSLYNTDGYYFSISDTFSDLGMTDLNYTSAYVDLSAGQVALPAVSAFTRRIPRSLIGVPSATMTINGAVAPFKEVAAFNGALEDGYDNEIWSVQVDSAAQGEAILQLVVPVGSVQDVVDLSRVDFLPHGVTPVQVFIETLAPANAGTSVGFEGFGSRISTSTTRMVFGDAARRVTAVRITMRKTSPDYTMTDSGSTVYRYIFGAREITFLHQMYDNDGTFVSARLGLPTDLENETVIDAVSLVVEDQVPANTEIRYWIAADDGELTTGIDQLDWRRVVPVGAQESDASAAVRFEGATAQVRAIRSNGVVPDVTLLPLNIGADDFREMNPSPVVIPGVDVWRLCAFEDEFLSGSMSLEEGVNTIRIAYVDRDEEAIESLDFWAPRLRANDVDIAYGRIDVGNDFLYGGDVGESDVSLYAETFIESETERQTFLAECHKADVNSQAWDVRVFLNGGEVGFLPVGTHRALLPWTLRQGLNHIIMLANVPSGTSTGTVSLMGDTSLYEYGTVKLATWSYVSLFDLSYNTTGSPTTFTVHDGEIISRRQPTDNFRLRWSKATGRGPKGVRFRADLSRDFNSPTVSPRLSSYRLRFAFGQEAV